MDQKSHLLQFSSAMNIKLCDVPTFLKAPCCPQAGRQLYCFRAAVRFYNAFLRSNSTTRSKLLRAEKEKEKEKLRKR
eukprot:1152780-Pelagomonas_calceolata.AAC.2